MRTFNETNGILNDRCLIWWKIEILCSKLMYHWVNLDYRGVNAMSNECRRCRTNAQATKGQIVSMISSPYEIKRPYITRACFSWSGIEVRDLEV